MTKNQSLLFRALLFLAGAGVVLLAFFLGTGGKELTKNGAFFWASIGVMYLIFWTPFFFSYITIGNFSVKIPRLSLLWLGVILYLFASIIILALVSANIISLTASVIAQAVMLFFFAVDVYFAFLSSQHVENVAVEEKTKLQYISEIKNKARITAIAVQGLPSQFANEQKIISQTFEEIKYISPARGGEDLEEQIMFALNLIAELCESASSGATPSGFEKAARNLQTLVKQRKLLRN
jgi:hypothetical protein